MGQSCRKACCCCCKDKKEPAEEPLLSEEIVIEGDNTAITIANQQQADKLIARSLAKYRHEKERPSPDIDGELETVEQGIARYNVKRAQSKTEPSKSLEN